MTVAVLGEALIDFIVGEDGSYRPHLGGSPYNVAIGLARQGIDVCYLSPLSDDVFGDQLKNSLEREGVAVSIARRSIWPTSLALVTLNSDGLPNYRLYREGVADKDTTFEEIQANMPEGLQVFHTGSLAITPSQLPKIRKLFERMRERKVVVSVDINIRLRASVDTKAYLEGVRALLPLTDIVKASDEDLRALEFATNTRRSAELAYEEMGSGMLVLTEGRDGATLFTANGTIKKKAYPVAEFKDTIGAGDTFHAAFLASMLRSDAIGKSLMHLGTEVLGPSLDFACAAAAINVSRAGCWPPTRNEVDDFIDSTRR